MFATLFDAKRRPLKTSVSKKTALSDESHFVCEFARGVESASKVNEIADFLYSYKVHSEKMSSMNLFHMIGM